MNSVFSYTQSRLINIEHQESSVTVAGRARETARAGFSHHDIQVSTLLISVIIAVKNENISGID